VPAVVQPDGPVAELGAGDQVEPVGLGDLLEQPGTLAGNIGMQVQRVREKTILRAAFMMPVNGWSAVGKAPAMPS
jgi:hypothetical protein